MQENIDEIKKIGANVNLYDDSVIIGKSNFVNGEMINIPDRIESGTFLLILNSCLEIGFSMKEDGIMSPKQLMKLWMELIITI